MEDDMFESAVLGVIGTSAMGAVRRCMDCREALAPDAPACTGFGVGCVVAQRREPEATRPRPAGE